MALGPPKKPNQILIQILEFNVNLSLNSLKEKCVPVKLIGLN
jgi:hypothetical protein